MEDLKQKFRDWLIQQGNKSGTITSYLSRLQKISDKDWDNLTSSIIPFLVKYYELANKEYYLDRVTILHALEYFSKISDNIYKNTNISAEFDVKLYIFDGKNDYFICDTTLKVLYDDLLLINRYLYESNDTFEGKYNSSIDPVKLSILIVDLKENCPVELQKLAIHIVYNKKQINDTKTALNKYCNFLYATYKTANYDCKTNNIITYIQILNPNKTINNNFIETRPITGKYARQVSPTMHDLLKTSITQSLEDEKKINASIRKKIAEEISLIDTRLERLWECYLDRDIDKAKYELEKQKYLEQKKDLNARVEKYSDISNGLKENIGKAIDFAANLSNLMKAASPDEKNMLLKRLLTNCVLDGEVLKYEIKAPFDKLLVCSNYKKWKDITIENLEEFENLN